MSAVNGYLQFCVRPSFPGPAPECCFPREEGSQRPAAGRGLGGQDKARVNPHCCTTNCVVPLRGEGGCWTLLEVIEVEMLFPVGKTLWKYTTKEMALVMLPVIRDLPIIFQSVESLLNLPWPEVTLQWKCICQKQIPSLRYQLYQQNNDEVSQEAFF